MSLFSRSKTGSSAQSTSSPDSGQQRPMSYSGPSRQSEGGARERAGASPLDYMKRMSGALAALMPDVKRAAINADAARDASMSADRKIEQIVELLGIPREIETGIDPMEHALEEIGRQLFAMNERLDTIDATQRELLRIFKDAAGMR